LAKLIKQLAQELKVHERPIKKLGVRTTAEAIRLAVQSGI